MAKVLVTDIYLSNIADAIREKNGGTDTYTPGQMAGAIAALPDAPVLVTKTITGNGVYDPEDDNADGYSGVTVTVPSSQPNLQSKTVTENGTVLPDAGYDGLSSVVVNVSGGGGQQYIANWDFTQSLVDSVSGLTAILNAGATQSASGISFTDEYSAIYIPAVLKGGLRAYEIDFGNIVLNTPGVHYRVFMPEQSKGLIYRNTGYWSMYNTNWSTDSNINSYDYFANSTMKIKIDKDGYWKIYKGDALVFEPNNTFKLWESGSGNDLFIGSPAGNSCIGAVVTGLRVY